MWEAARGSPSPALKALPRSTSPSILALAERSRRLDASSSDDCSKWGWGAILCGPRKAGGRTGSLAHEVHPNSKARHPARLWVRLDQDIISRGQILPKHRQFPGKFDPKDVAL